MHASKFDGYDGLFVLSMNVVCGAMLREIHEMRSLIVLVCAVVMLVLYIRIRRKLPN